MLFISTISVGQSTLKLQYRYYYNSDMIFDNKVYDPIWNRNKHVETVLDYSHSSYFGLDAYVPFTSFDEESPLRNERFSFSMSAHYLYNHDANKFHQQYYNFGLHYKPIKDENIQLSAILYAAEIFDGTKLPVWTGVTFKAGVSYNTVERLLPNLLNFYGSINYMAYAKYNTLFPYGNKSNYDNDIEMIIGAVINIKDHFFIEQGFRNFTSSNLPSLTFSPYYSDYNTTLRIKVKKLELDFTHICFHPIEGDNKNPRISGTLNSFGLTYKL